ncbi:MAG: SUMF1/EgtB/PvdO family nonheme iron enzyme [Desulfobacterales bacterium]|nr:SUMF1/EgtB/PvdO family nonheme iron enzyme [Desulfobacterales bacterium]
MKKIFISYAREDYEIARKLFDDLKEVAEPWLDRECLLPGERWKPGIRQAIKKTDFFLALLSSRSVPKKGFVQTELDTALNELRNYPPDQIYIIPARLDKCIPKHEILHDLNWVDLFPSYEAGLEKILLVLEAYKEPDEAAQVSESPSNQEIKLSDKPEIPIEEPEPKPEKEPASELEKQPETKQEPESETEIIELENVAEPSSEPSARSEYIEPEKPKPHIPKSAPVKKRRRWKPVFAVLFVLLVIAAYFIVKSYFPAKDTNTVEIKDENHTERIEPEEEKPPEPLAKYNLVVKTDPSGAEVKFISPDNLKYSPGVMLESGDYEIEVSMEGFEKQSQPVIIKNGPWEKVVKLEREKVPLTVRSNVHDDIVYIDGKEYGSTPLWNIVLETGKHVVTVRKEGYEPYEKPVDLKKDTPPVIAKLKPVIETVKVETEPEGADVFVNRKKEGISPLELKLPVTEEAIVSVAMAGYMPQKKAVEFPLENNVLKFDLKKVLVTETLGMKFVYIKPGAFTMGSPDESEKGRNGDEKQHRVTLTKGFYMQTTEVTQRQWKAIMGSNPSSFKGCEECPVENVSWNDTQEFIKKLNQKREGVYRLPTEAEWEYAARAGTDTPFYFGKCLSTDQANYNGNYPLEGCPKGEYREKTTPVASFKANLWGLYDMHGNVWEWCQDWYSNYPSTAVSDPSGPKTGSDRVFRGGSWGNAAGRCRSASRNHYSPGGRSRYLGFRLSSTFNL